MCKEKSHKNHYNVIKQNDPLRDKAIRILCNKSFDDVNLHFIFPFVCGFSILLLYKTQIVL